MEKAENQKTADGAAAAGCVYGPEKPSNKYTPGHGGVIAPSPEDYESPEEFFEDYFEWEKELLFDPHLDQEIKDYYWRKGQTEYLPAARAYFLPEIERRLAILADIAEAENQRRMIMWEESLRQAQAIAQYNRTHAIRPVYGSESEALQAYWTSLLENGGPGALAFAPGGVFDHTMLLMWGFTGSGEVLCPSDPCPALGGQGVPSLVVMPNGTILFEGEAPTTTPASPPEAPRPPEPPRPSQGPRPSTPSGPRQPVQNPGKYIDGAGYEKIIIARGKNGYIEHWIKMTEADWAVWNKARADMISLVHEEYAHTQPENFRIMGEWYERWWAVFRVNRNARAATGAANQYIMEMLGE